MDLGLDTFSFLHPNSPFCYVHGFIIWAGYAHGFAAPYLLMLLLIICWPKVKYDKKNIIIKYKLCQYSLESNGERKLLKR